MLNRIGSNLWEYKPMLTTDELTTGAESPIEDSFTARKSALRRTALQETAWRIGGLAAALGLLESGMDGDIQSPHVLSSHKARLAGELQKLGGVAGRLRDLLLDVQAELQLPPEVAARPPDRQPDQPVISDEQVSWFCEVR